ncbi:L,D-transpeptidase family protein [Methylacidiphilales bacterium]|nr:L,D-transpeptidase family protein [Candidatus Methylacidiphilales bacterium]
MNTSRIFSILFTAFVILSLVAACSATAHADGFTNDSKHGTTSTHAASASSDYARFLWLCSGDSQQEIAVNHIVVSLADQRLYAYHDQQLVAWSNVSSGRPGHETPTGAFTVSEKDVDHHSNLYNNAPMPYFMRLTDGGVGLHAGELPGYPASHGCVRLPLGMARELYHHVEAGTPVEIISSSIGSSVAQDGKTASAVHLAQD